MFVCAVCRSISKNALGSLSALYLSDLVKIFIYRRKIIFYRRQETDHHWTPGLYLANHWHDPLDICRLWDSLAFRPSTFPLSFFLLMACLFLWRQDTTCKNIALFIKRYFRQVERMCLFITLYLFASVFQLQSVSLKAVFSKWVFFSCRNFFCSTLQHFNLKNMGETYLWLLMVISDVWSNTNICVKSPLTLMSTKWNKNFEPGFM